MKCLRKFVSCLLLNRVYDSTAKIPTSILNGNVNQYGDFDQCLKIKHVLDTANRKKISIRGKYCLASFQIKLSGRISSNMKYIYDLIHSHHAFRSELDDPGHRIPRFSSITWGMCIPDGCSSSDVQNVLQKVLNEYSDTNSTSVTVSVDPQMCQFQNEFHISYGSLVVGLLFLIMFAIVTWATVCDLTTVPLKNEIIMSFSLKRTINELFSLKRPNADIKSIHGIRFLNAIMLIISHKSMALFFYPFLNRTEMAESFGKPWSVIGRAASLYTDPFIMFSGLLTYNSIMNRLEKNKNVNIIDEYVGRLFRLIPTLSALILFCTWILPIIGSGPQWPLVVQHHADTCKKYWWRNYLFIHNYFGFENMCLTHTHHIGIDTQLFFIGVPLIILMGTNKRFEEKTIKILVAFAILLSLAKFHIAYTMKLANYVYFGASVQQLFKTANYVYTIPAYRFPVYAMGIILAKLLRRAPDIKFTQKHLIIGWIIAAASFCIAFFGPSGMGHTEYKYNSFHNALYTAFGPIAWCYSFAWIIYTSHHGYYSFLGNLFSSRVFIIWTRLSYAVYLTQFPIFFYNIGIRRTQDHFKLFEAMINITEFIVIALASVILTLVFDLPFQKIKNILGQKKSFFFLNNKEIKED